MPQTNPALSRKLNHGPPVISSRMNFHLTYVAENLIQPVHVHIYVPGLVKTSPQTIRATQYVVFTWQGLSEMEVDINLCKISPFMFLYM